MRYIGCVVKVANCLSFIAKCLIANVLNSIMLCLHKHVFLDWHRLALISSKRHCIHTKLQSSIKLSVHYTLVSLCKC